MNYNLPPDEGKKKKDLYWNVFFVLGILAVIMFGFAANTDDPGRYDYQELHYVCDDGEIIDTIEDVTDDGVDDCGDGSDEVDSEYGVADFCGGLMCCCSLIFAISALSTKNDTQRVVVVQQQPQYVPIVQQVMAPSTPPPTTQGPAISRSVQLKIWQDKAKNFELARNWEGAAEMYESAGMYAEAGRIRQEHLEQNQPVVQIGHVGNTVLNDSVMIAESTNRTCVNCGNTAESSWKICPHCSNPL